MKESVLEIVSAVQRRASSAQTRTDHSDLLPTSLAPVLSDDTIRSIESERGFRVPTVLRDVYLEIGNGGFGPGYGLLGLVGGFSDDQGHSSVQLYDLFRDGDSEDPTWEWPAGLLPICHWGCAIYSCVDCSSDEGPILIWDPNELSQATLVSKALRPGHSSIADWFRDWAAGASIWSLMFPDRDRRPA